MAQKHIVEVVIDEEQLLGELLMEDTGNQLQHTLLHGSACPIQLLLTARGSHHKGQLRLSTRRFGSLTGTGRPQRLLQSVSKG